MQKGWSDTTVEKYEELYDYVQKDEGFIEFSADKKSKQLAAYNEEIRQLREYLTTSQSDLKAFITKNLGSNNANKALKLAKETKQILKDFEVSKSITLRGCFPTTIDAIDVSFDTADTISEFTATIRYQFWTSNTTDNVG